MKITLTVPDELYEGYLRQAKNLPVKADMLMVKALQQLAGVIPDDRAILLQGDERRAIEEVFQTTVDSAADLVRKVRLASAVKIGEVSRPLTPGEASMLASQAGFHGQSVEAYVKTSVDKVMEQLLNGIY
jgi:hypothetical protein